MIDQEKDFDEVLAESLLEALAKSVGGGFHPDTRGANYVSDDYSRTMSDDTAHVYDEVMDYVFTTLGDATYVLALAALHRMLTETES